MKTSRLGLLLIITLTLWSANALASVSGSCANCHTMHATDGSGAALAGGAKGSLTIGGCVGCHTGNNEEADGASAGAGGIPYVMDTAEPTYGPEFSGGALVASVQTLAGGSFWWVGKDAGADKTTGHNVTTDGLCDFDMDAPGRRDTDQSIFASGTPLTCAGTMGCHGDRTVSGDYASISGAHHGSDAGGIDGSSVAKSFRFLDGILGTEAPDWEYAASISNHNSYKAEARSEASAMADAGDTISSLCGQCHGDFHSGTNTVSDGSAWLRHPTDIVLPGGSTEYASYSAIYGETGVYNIIAPVGVASPVAATADVTLANSVVTCISCHRAHGSPYADLLRWDYANISAGSQIGGVDNNGCFACHTSKDG